jgi:Ser/Thr protein kinase RdoA (MazF antagonist)
MFPFVPGSHSIDVVETPRQAYEAATQFGRFTRLLHGIDVKKLKLTIPCFHDLTLRYEQFLQALEKGNKQRIEESKDLIRSLVSHTDIVTKYGYIKTSSEFKLRVTHHDTKISNVLFDAEGKGLCVIDLDTVMPGYFISDVGDMMRTYLSPVSEEEKEFSKIEVRDEFYKAIVQGYYNEMKDELTVTEKKYFFYSGTFMIYMQALRFATDYLNDDVYYGAKYPRHNLIRAKNQTVLLERLLGKKEQLENMKLDV